MHVVLGDGSMQMERPGLSDEGSLIQGSDSEEGFGGQVVHEEFEGGEASEVTRSSRTTSLDSIIFWDEFDKAKMVVAGDDWDTWHALVEVQAHYLHECRELGMPPNRVVDFVGMVWQCVRDDYSTAES